MPAVLEGLLDGFGHGYLARALFKPQCRPCEQPAGAEELRKAGQPSGIARFLQRGLAVDELSKGRHDVAFLIIVAVSSPADTPRVGTASEPCIDPGQFPDR